MLPSDCACAVSAAGDSVCRWGATGSRWTSAARSRTSSRTGRTPAPTRPEKRRRRRNDLTEGVFAALAQVVDVVPEIGFFVHGTTVGLNAFLQRRGERVSAARHGGRRRHLPDRPRQPDEAVRAPLPQACAARSAAGHGRDRRPARLGGRGADAARRGGRPCRRPSRRDRSLRRRRRLLPLRLPQPGARAARRGDPARGAR